MPEIHTDIVAQVILLAREAEDNGSATSRRELTAFLAGLTEDDGYMLVALAWVGRESFSADEFDEAERIARQEATTALETYLGNMPLLADYLEDGLEAMGINPSDAEDDLMRLRQD